MWEVDEFRLSDTKLPGPSTYKSRIAFNKFDKFIIQYAERKGQNENSVNIEALKFESILMNNLNHPYIQKCLELRENALLKKKGTHIPITYGIYEYVGKNDLFDLISKTSGLQEEIAIYYLKQMAEAIKYLHERKIYHRNLKVENFLVNDNFTQVKLKGLKSSTNKNYNTDHNIVGTKFYIAPEIIKQEQYLGEEIDIFSLGVTLFIMIFGKVPFHSASSIDGSYQMIMQKNSEKFWNEVNLKIKKTISDELKELIFSMLAYNPLDRPSVKHILANALLESIEKKITPDFLRIQFQFRLNGNKEEERIHHYSNSSTSLINYANSSNTKFPFITELHITPEEISPIR